MTLRTVTRHCTVSISLHDANSSPCVLRAVTVQLANKLKGEGFTFIAMHPGMTVFPV